jgi:hypothetical protein
MRMWRTILLLAAPAMWGATTLIPLTTSDWAYWSDLYGTHLPTASGRFEDTPEGLKFFGDGYRGSARIHTLAAFNTLDCRVYIKWKVNGYGYMGIDARFSTGAMPWVQLDAESWYLHFSRGASTGGWTTGHSYNGSTVIADEVWHYTRAVITASALSATTAVGDFDDAGGTVIHTAFNALSGPSYLVNLVFNIGDNYAGTAAYMIIGEVKLDCPDVDTLGPITSQTLAAPNPVAVGNGITVTAKVDDSTTGGSAIGSAEFSLDGAGFTPVAAVDATFDEVAEDVTASLGAFSQAGVHSICARGIDRPGNVGAADCIQLAVYDPNGGFVTGGGRVQSPAGADLANPGASGPASFGFVSKYLPGASTPSGNLQFQFQAGNLRFHSTSTDWLVVTGEPRAIFRGEGLLNGATACKFEVDAWDGSFQSAAVDAFGLKVYSCASGGDRYSLPATSLVGGSIIIHRQ